jgi:hypothetical protein
MRRSIQTSMMIAFAFAAASCSGAGNGLEQDAYRPLGLSVLDATFA